MNQTASLFWSMNCQLHCDKLVSFDIGIQRQWLINNWWIALSIHFDIGM